VAGKSEFAALLDELDIPQPRWWPATEAPAAGPFPRWVKASYGTAGRGVRRVAGAEAEQQAIRDLSAGGEQVMVQLPAAGQYGQVQALFDRGRLVAAHTSVAIGAGAGGSAAARLSVDHPAARAHAARIGEHLSWHGGLTLDYFHTGGEPQFIECNPRTVEPGNAARSGVDFPALTIALSAGRPLPDRPVFGRAGVRTRSALALAIGAAERHRSRLAVLRSLVTCAARRGEIGRAAEVLTPVLADPPSLLPLLVAAGQLLADPDKVSEMAAGAVRSSAISPHVIERVTASPSRAGSG